MAVTSKGRLITSFYGKNGRNLSRKEISMTQPTYLLVHGAWGGAWVWRDVGAELTRRDVPWTAVDLPSSLHGAHPNTYLADDAKEVVEVAKFDGPVVLVGHSYGGAVICEAAESVAHLERLVYVAALVPLLGESATETTREANGNSRRRRLPHSRAHTRQESPLPRLPRRDSGLGGGTTDPPDPRELPQSA
jgi:pimeloyl-ACP methyl ester carboxylesterase